jgi:hypothetical protein
MVPSCKNRRFNGGSWPSPDSKSFKRKLRKLREDPRELVFSKTLQISKEKNESCTVHLSSLAQLQSSTESGCTARNYSHSAVPTREMLNCSCHCRFVQAVTCHSSPSREWTTLMTSNSRAIFPGAANRITCQSHSHPRFESVAISRAKEAGSARVRRSGSEMSHSCFTRPGSCYMS